MDPIGSIGTDHKNVIGLSVWLWYGQVHRGMIPDRRCDMEPIINDTETADEWLADFETELDAIIRELNVETEE